MLRIFRTNSVYNYILLPIIGALLLIKSFLDTKGISAEGFSISMPSMPKLEFPSSSMHLFLFLGYISVMFICFQLLKTNSRFAFIKERTFLPSYLFLFIVLTLPKLHFFNPAYISAVFSLMAINTLFAAYEGKNSIDCSFNAGFFIGIGSLFYLSNILLVILIPISIFFLKGKITWREIITPIIGIVLPWLFVFTYYFATNSTALFIENITNYISYKGESIIHNYFIIGYFSFLLIIIVVSSLFVLKQNDEEKIKIRRYFKILFLFFFSSLLFLIFPFVSIELIVISILPLTFIITNYLTFLRRRFWAEFFFILLILISFTLQFLIEWMRAG